MLTLDWQDLMGGDLDVSQNAKDNVSFDFSGWPYHVSL